VQQDQAQSARILVTALTELLKALFSPPVPEAVALARWSSPFLRLRLLKVLGREL
jgi:hypothetical protein